MMKEETNLGSKRLFFKVVAESVDVFGKRIMLDKNCGDLEEVHSIVKDHPEFLKEDITWIVYPMSIVI